jgi:hypothetical protein
VVPPQLQGGAGALIPFPEKGVQIQIQNGPQIVLPGRNVVFHNGGQILCEFAFSNPEWVISGVTPSTHKLVITLNIEDERQLVSFSRNEEINFDARAFCSQGQVGSSGSELNQRCFWGNLTFITQKVSNKSE